MELRRSLLLAAVMGAAGVALLGVEAAFAATPARALVLQPADLPDGFTRESNGPLRKVGDRRFGFLGGWEASYERPTLTGTAFVYSLVGVYRDAGGARSAMRATAARIERDPESRGATLRSRVGSESRLFRIESTRGSGYVVLWRSRNRLALLTVAGAVNVDVHQAVSLALANQRRLER